MKKKGKTHFNNLYKALEGQRIAESKLYDAKRAVEANQRSFREERDQWTKEKADLILTCNSAIIAKAGAEAKAEAQSKGSLQFWFI